MQPAQYKEGYSSFITARNIYSGRWNEDEEEKNEPIQKTNVSKDQSL